MSYIFGAKIRNVYEILRASNYRICQCLSETCGQDCGDFRFISEKEVSKTGIYRLSISSHRIIYTNNEFTFQVFSQDSKA